jgi:hypothetical protein
VREIDLRIGTTVWVESTDGGDVSHKVKLILEKQPKEHEYCKLCGQGQLVLMGHLVQMGLLDHKVYAVMLCEHCRGVTAFVYHVEARPLDFPEEGNTDE